MVQDFVRANHGEHAGLGVENHLVGETALVGIKLNEGMPKIAITHKPGVTDNLCYRLRARSLKIQRGNTTGADQVHPGGGVDRLRLGGTLVGGGRNPQLWGGCAAQETVVAERFAQRFLQHGQVSGSTGGDPGAGGDFVHANAAVLAGEFFVDEPLLERYGGLGAGGVGLVHGDEGALVHVPFIAVGVKIVVVQHAGHGGVLQIIDCQETGGVKGLPGNIHGRYQ